MVYLKWRAYLCVKFMENILEIVSLVRLLRVKQFKKLLDKLGLHKLLERLNVDTVVYDELEEKLVNALQVGPGGVNLLVLLNARLREAKIRLFDVGEGPEDIALNHVHGFLYVGQDHLNDEFLVGGELFLELGNHVHALLLRLLVLLVVLVVVDLGADSQAAQVALLGVLAGQGDAVLAGSLGGGRRRARRRLRSRGCRLRARFLGVLLQTH